MSNQYYPPPPASGQNPADQPVPFSPEAEEAVLGAILTNSNAYFNIASFLKADDFYLLRHKYIWQAFQRIIDRNELVDHLTVSKELRDVGHLEEIGGTSYLIRLVNSTPSLVNIDTYGKLVERAAVRRRLLAAADEIKALALTEHLDIEAVTDEAEARLFSVTESQLKRDLVPMKEVIHQYYEHMEHLMQNRDQALGLPTGFRALDTMLGGLQKSDLLIFAGRPGMGKCVARGTLIPTEMGLVPIETLKPDLVDGIPDDEGGIFYPLEIGVQTPGGIRQTTYFYDSGVKPTLTITTRAGYSVTGTHIHPILTLSRTRKKGWKTLCELQSGDCVAVRNTNVESEYYWDEVTRVEDSGLQPCYDLTIPDGHAFVANGIVNHNTSFMLSVALNAARFDKRIAIFTMEMGVEQIVQRMISMETGINMQRLRLGQVDEQEWRRVLEALSRLNNFKIFIDDTPALTPTQMRAKCRRLAREHGVDLVMVDYIQLMNAGGTFENNRVQEVSLISRNLKELARELNVPLFSAAQLSRAVEQRQDKRPQLSDLRESGCLAGDSLVYLADSGCYVPIRELNGRKGFRVLSLNPQTWKLEAAEVSNAFCTGVKPVYRLTTQLGRSIRATANHKFLTIHGWKRLDELIEDDCIALPRVLPGASQQTMTNAELALLGHLIGDGCTLPTHAIQYTTREIDLAETVAQLASEVFGDKVKPRIHKETGHNWYQVFIPPSFPLTHGVRNPVGVWLEELGVYGLRSYEKRIPEKVFTQPTEAIALFLRHLWATDGSIQLRKMKDKDYPTIYYASSSQVLARDVQSLLLRLGINAVITCVPQHGKGRNQYHVVLGGKSDFQRFITLIKAVGERKQRVLDLISQYLVDRYVSSKRDFVPKEVWTKFVVPIMGDRELSNRQMLLQLGLSGTVASRNMTRERAAHIAEVIQSDELSKLSQSHIYWDQIVSIEPDGETDVYDLTVPNLSNFISNNIIVHNSLEQDSDIVMFLYRDEVYNEATENPNQADVIIAKHRNGPTGTISLYFDKTITRFLDATAHSIDLSRG